MEIIRLEKNYIRRALDLVWTVFEEFEAPEYSKEGIEEFRKFILYDSIIEKLEKGELNFWSCIDNDILLGVIATKEIDHICLLFVRKEYHKQGIARNLFQKVKKICNDYSNIKEITVNSSPYAVEVYHRLGFVDTDKEQTVNGIRFTPMLYSLK